MPERDPHSEFEDEGIPDLQDGVPEQEWAVDPQRAPLPADEPTAVDDYGTTAAEQSEGEPLDLRVEREEPEEQAMFGGTGAATERPAGEQRRDRADDPDALTEEGGLGPGSDLDTVYEPGNGTAPGWDAQPEEPSGIVWDEPRPAGRLVAPDQGARSQDAPDGIAAEAGPDAGGYSAEETAMRVEEDKSSGGEAGGHVTAGRDWSAGDEDDPDSGAGRTGPPAS